MRKDPFFRSILLMIMLLVLIFPSASVSASDRQPANGVQLTAIGHPLWKPVDIHLFSAPIGTADDGYSEFFYMMSNILPPPNHILYESTLGTGGVGPGIPHKPPYTNEIAEGLARLRYHQGTSFRASEFSNGAGINIAWMTVPNHGAIGSSPDFQRGQIIPNSLFPIRVYGTTTHNGSSFNPYLVDFSVPNITAIDPKFSSLDGHSHFPMWVSDSIEFGPPGTKINGTYTYLIDLTDATGNGWHIAASFSVGHR
jgi:hypothetical protein